MLYKLINNKPNPYSVEQFRKDNPRLAFSGVIPSKYREEQNIIEILPKPKPKITTSQKLVLNTTPTQNDDGSWALDWTIVSLTEDEQREWRNSELERTDILAVLPDYPNKEALLAYRQALRDWTATEDFPETRPTLGE